MKKAILATLALTLVMSLCLAACGSTEPSDMGEVTGHGTGLVLGYPIVGATVEDYASRLDAYLSGEETEESVSLVPEEGATAAYVVTVVDQNGDPVPGVYVNFCTSTTCNMATSDENGVINFEGPALAYHVDVLKMPEGYSFDKSSDIFTENESCSLTLTLTRN